MRELQGELMFETRTRVMMRPEVADAPAAPDFDLMADLPPPPAPTMAARREPRPACETRGAGSRTIYGERANSLSVTAVARLLMFNGSLDAGEAASRRMELPRAGWRDRVRGWFDRTGTVRTAERPDLDAPRRFGANVVF